MNCGDLSNGQNGPFDYRTERDKKLQLVEEFHFTSKVENLFAGQSGSLTQDLNYVLRAFPNHHRALVSLARLAERAKLVTIPGMPFSVECYFERAVRFRPDDGTARMLYAGYLNKSQRRADALAQLAAVQELAKDNPFTHYNLGLMYAELSAYESALKHAHRAAELGFPRRELQQKLETAGKWVPHPPADPPPSPVGSASQPGG
ncbi:MAG: hypothetical protein C0505_03585 [Leptothrix sp. (in: Bacteria)]|nr:hypothetical protein [Leptothrix sp. (in: b-proteobacteria)]